MYEEFFRILIEKSNGKRIEGEKLVDFRENLGKEQSEKINVFKGLKVILDNPWE